MDNKIIPLVFFANKAIPNILQELHSSEKGLSENETAKRLEAYGYNILMHLGKILKMFYFTPMSTVVFKQELKILLMMQYYSFCNLDCHFPFRILVMIKPATISIIFKILCLPVILRNPMAQPQNLKEVLAP